jgi:hypothetical protein
VRAVGERFPFEAAGGTVAGRRHTAAGRNNQDAFHIDMDPQALSAVVCDGCSSGARSEVGAAVGARLVARELRRGLASGGEPDRAAFWEGAAAALVATLGRLADAMGGDRAAVVEQHFLFTIVGALVTRRAGWVFALGDGLIVVDGAGGTRIELGPFAGNAPPYLGHALADPSVAREFVVRGPFDATALRSIVLGSDGLLDLERGAGRKVPGRDARVGPLADFVTDDLVFRNPDVVRRRLAALNRECVAAPGGRREFGLLPDDTTLVAIRRARPEEG